MVANLLDYTYKPVMGDLPTLQLPQVGDNHRHASSKSGVCGQPAAGA